MEKSKMPACKLVGGVILTSLLLLTITSPAMASWDLPDENPDGFAIAPDLFGSAKCTVNKLLDRPCAQPLLLPAN
jgi:hypothetical protein